MKTAIVLILWFLLVDVSIIASKQVGEKSIKFKLAYLVYLTMVLIASVYMIAMFVGGLA